MQDERPFVSCRKVLMEMGAPYSQNQELLSFHTVSKGSLGECGLRGGYVETTNIHPGAVDEIYKIASINLSPNIMGQVLAVVDGKLCAEAGPHACDSVCEQLEEQRDSFEQLQACAQHWARCASMSASLQACSSYRRSARLDERMLQLHSDFLASAASSHMLLQRSCSWCTRCQSWCPS